MSLGSVSPLVLCQCYLNTMVGKPQKISMTSLAEVARPIKDHVYHRIPVVASNYSQYPKLCALIDYAYT